MNKIIYLLVLLLNYGCIQRDKNQNFDQSAKTYTTRLIFGQNRIQILQTELDSLLNTLPYGLLDGYQTTDLQEKKAVELLKEKFKAKGLCPKDFLIYEMMKHNDSLIVFHINHIDSFVYYHNLDKLNKKASQTPSSEEQIEEMIPITGNISGYDGCYTVNTNSKKMEVILSQ